MAVIIFLKNLEIENKRLETQNKLMRMIMQQNDVVTFLSISLSALIMDPSAGSFYHIWL